jgi:hypothetical protein
LNYRLNSRFAELNNKNISEAIKMIPTHDQLIIARKENNYPGYFEPPIIFLPGYKLAFKKTEYIDKKD